MAILQASDFANKFEIHTNGVNLLKVTSYIERYEESYIIDMLGVELGELFLADLEEPTPDPIYTFLYEPFNYQNDYEILKSRGLVDMLLGFIYFEYLRDMKVQQTINIPVKVKGQNSDRANTLNMGLFERYNDSIVTYQAIQKYICENTEDYPTFKGVEKVYSYLSY